MLTYCHVIVFAMGLELFLLEGTEFQLGVYLPPGRFQLAKAPTL